MAVGAAYLQIFKPESTTSRYNMYEAPIIRWQTHRVELDTVTIKMHLPTKDVKSIKQ